MRITIIISLFAFSFSCYGQGNCSIYAEGSGERKACELSYQAIEQQQGSKESQLIFDEAISVGPTYAWAYYEKSVPYLKRGFLPEGLEILNKAVALEPLNYLTYRAYWYWQYRNYELCVQDLEQFYLVPKTYVETTPGGEKDMRIILGLAYAKIGDYDKAIQTIKDCISSYDTEDNVGLSDYHTLGVLYLKNEQYDKAIEAFEQQFTVYEHIADSYYFLGLAYNGKKEYKQARAQFGKALLVFNSDRGYSNPNAGFRVYESDILREIEKRKR